MSKTGPLIRGKRVTSSLKIKKIYILIKKLEKQMII